MVKHTHGYTRRNNSAGVFVRRLLKIKKSATNNYFAIRGLIMERTSKKFLSLATEDGYIELRLTKDISDGYERWGDHCFLVRSYPTMHSYINMAMEITREQYEKINELNAPRIAYIRKVQSARYLELKEKAKIKEAI